MALLENADANRLYSNEIEVENNYKHILKRTKSPLQIKLKALINFATYLYSSKGKTDKALKLFDDYYHLFAKSPEFISKYSTYLWNSGTLDSRYKAIDIIVDYFKTKPRIDKEVYLEFLGNLMTYSAILVVTERDELKTKKKFEEISSSDYSLLYNEQRSRFFGVYNYPGLRLYKLINSMNLAILSPNCRNYVLDGLTHFIEICIRTNHWDKGKEICEKVFNELTENYHKPFLFKHSRIESLERPEEKINPFEKVNNNDMAIKLKEALKSK